MGNRTNNPQRDAVKLFDFVDGGDGAMMVVGIAESAEFAPGYQFEMAPRRDAGILVVAEDGSLKWRPLPRMPLLLCERPQGALRNIVEVNMHAPLPAAALPPYHGFYVDGQRIYIRQASRRKNGPTSSSGSSSNHQLRMSSGTKRPTRT